MRTESIAAARIGVLMVDRAEEETRFFFAPLSLRRGDGRRGGTSGEEGGENEMRAPFSFSTVDDVAVIFVNTLLSNHINSCFACDIPCVAGRGGCSFDLLH